MIKTYTDISQLFDEGIISPTDILIVWGKRGKGKSSFMGKLQSDLMKHKNAEPRIEFSKYKCERLRQAGITIEPPEDHLVFSDTFFEDNSLYGEQRRPYETSALDFVIPNKIHTGGIVCPCSCLFWDEIQDLYDSHNGAVPSFVSKAFELSRQIGVFICMACQRPMRIVKDIRDLATFVEVVKVECRYFRGLISETIWTLNIIYDNSQFEAYDSDKKNEEYIDRTIKMSFAGDIYECYDPDYFMPMFYQGLEEITPVYKKVQRTEFTPDGFERFASRRVIDIPETFRGKKPREQKPPIKPKEQKSIQKPEEVA